MGKVVEKVINKHIHVFEGNARVLLEMPHSGLFGFEPSDKIHPSLAPKINSGSAELRKAIGAGCDASVSEMTGFNSLINDLNLYGIRNDLARVLCDTNREKDQVSDWAVKRGSPDDHRHGVIWDSVPIIGADLNLSDQELKDLLTTKAERILKEPLTQRKFSAFMKDAYDPYHAQLQYFHEQIIRRHDFCIHIALHSMPPFFPKKVCGAYMFGSQKAQRGSFDQQNNTLPDVILIHNNYKAASRVHVETIKYVFQSAGLIVEDGKGPFLGDIGVTKKYGDPLKYVEVIGIEHVAHETEPGRHLGSPEVDLEKARKFQNIYRQAISQLL